MSHEGDEMGEDAIYWWLLIRLELFCIQMKETERELESALNTKQSGCNRKFCGEPGEVCVQDD